MLRRPKFRDRLAHDTVRDFVAAVVTVSDVVADPPPLPAPETTDPDDEFLVALARIANVDAIISGDSDLLDAALADPPVITPARFMTDLTETWGRASGSL